MEKIIGILDTDEQYVLRLCRYLNQKHPVPFKAMAFTDPEAFSTVGSEYEPALLLVSEVFRDHLPETVSSCPCVYLSETESDPEALRINRYQGTDHLIKELLSFLNGGYSFAPFLSTVPLTAVYAPSGGCGRSVLALTYASVQSKKRRVLYVNLEEYAALDDLFGSPKKGLSDAIYYYLSDPENPGKILSCISRFQGFDFFYPVVNPEDLADLSAADLFGMLTLLRDSALYDEIILDLGALIKQPWLVLEQCETVLEPVPEYNVMSRKKSLAFHHFLENSCYRTITERIRIIRLPYLERLSTGQPCAEWICTQELEQILRRNLHG